MTNLAGHDMESVLEGFHTVEGDEPVCFVAYTVKGFGLPLAGHKDNHAGLMTPDQMAAFKDTMGIGDGDEWEAFAGLDVPADALRAFLDSVPFKARRRPRGRPPAIPVTPFPVVAGARMSTQEAFGRIMNELGRNRSTLARHVVTTSPDVTVSTSLGGWVNQRGLFHRKAEPDVFRVEDVPSAQRWTKSPGGQHIELGIAENNLFLLLSALGLAEALFGTRLLPIGTLYDPFIHRGLDALTYAAYQDSRFMVVATPSGIALAPEGGAHQSVITPLIGLGHDGLADFEPAFADELGVCMAWGLSYMQADDGGSVYLRLSTRALDQPDREVTEALKAGIIAGGYWLRPPSPRASLAIAYSGAVAPEALAAHEQIAEDVPGAGLLAVTSPGRLHAGWLAACRARAENRAAPPAPVETLLAGIAPDAVLVTAQDGHPAGLDWLGSVARHRVTPLGVDRFGQSGDIPDLFRTYGIDTDAIVGAAAEASLMRMAEKASARS